MPCIHESPGVLVHGFFEPSFAYWLHASRVCACTLYIWDRGERSCVISTCPSKRVLRFVYFLGFLLQKVFLAYPGLSLRLLFLLFAISQRGVWEWFVFVSVTLLSYIVIDLRFSRRVHILRLGSLWRRRYLLGIFSARVPQFFLNGVNWIGLDALELNWIVILELGLPFPFIFLTYCIVRIPRRRGSWFIRWSVIILKVVLGIVLL